MKSKVEKPSQMMLLQRNVELLKMEDNLFWRLRTWMLSQTNKRIVTLSELVDKVHSAAPKAIKNNRKSVVKVVIHLWSAAGESKISEDQMLKDDLKETLDYYFPKKK